MPTSASHTYCPACGAWVPNAIWNASEHRCQKQVSA